MARKPATDDGPSQLWKGGLAAAIGVALLTGLGVWQLQRLEWKTALINERSAEIASPPQAFAAVLAAHEAGQRVDYRPVTLSGRFRTGQDLRLFSSAFGPGWEIITPFETVDGLLVLVDRGFVADKGENTPIPVPATGPTAIIGHARIAPPTRTRFTPVNEPRRNRWFWFDLAAMGQATSGTVAPLWIQLAAGAESPVGEPRPVPPVVTLANNHLGYALSWFGLAGALAAIAILRLRKPRSSRA